MRYQVVLSGKIPHEINAINFLTMVGAGWLYRTGPNTARVKPGILAWVEGPELRLKNPETNAGVSIPSSWRAVERARVFGDKGIVGDTERTRAIQENYGPKSSANEIVVRRQFE